MELSPLAKRLYDVLGATARDTTTLAGANIPDLRVMAAGARELVENTIHDRHPSLGTWSTVVAAGIGGMDARLAAWLAEKQGVIAVAENTVVFGWEVERRALFSELLRSVAWTVPRRPMPIDGLDWLAEQPGYLGFTRTALESAEARVARLQAGEIPYTTRLFDDAEVAALGRAVRLALHRDETWLPDLLDGLVRGIAVAPTNAKTLPSQALLYEIARATEDRPTPEAIASLRTAARITRHAGVPKELAKKFKRIEPTLADRLDVAFRMPDGRLRETFGEHTAVISTDGAVELSWWHGDRKLKSVPAAVRRDHPDDVKRLKDAARQAAQRQLTLARALEAGYTSPAPPPYRQLEGNPVADRLIWEFEVTPGVWEARLGLTVPDVPVRLWHPARASVEEVRAWREVVQDKEIRQPFKQAFREVYLLTPAEEASGVGSRRFEGHIVHYSRIRALFKDRGWASRYMGFWDGGHDDGQARRVLAGGQWRATLSHHLYEEGYAQTSVVTFDRHIGDRWREAPLTEVPPLVFSEAMRDADLFVGVSSIMSEPQWADREPGELRHYWESCSFAELSSSAEVRRDALARLLPRLTIADRCTLTGRYLVVRGDLRTYRIHLNSANILMEPNDAYLCIVAKTTASSGLFLPFEEDGRLSLILSKAFLLADDTAITDPTIVRQIRAA
ncbi:DUF4132 domain-containing protein [Herbidospora sp. NEAU-GS84]|uniref:DUF4132 domain-containing protein n=1 Tax=Herbidospora solisilvae TaxID=2696284 RepID=A0A7C9N042_9ACTN|nr:DUF4132 domain-containing protein [Herbidospora solisilvae]NAS21849.1 DUF4132 domain-containing protein [Herbidospora solisilvae]